VKAILGGGFSRLELLDDFKDVHFGFEARAKTALAG
jgi:hypothetical protein